MAKKAKVKIYKYEDIKPKPIQVRLFANPFQVFKDEPERRFVATYGIRRDNSEIFIVEIDFEYGEDKYTIVGPFKELSLFAIETGINPSENDSGFDIVFDKDGIKVPSLNDSTGEVRVTSSPITEEERRKIKQFYVPLSDIYFSNQLEKG